LATSVATQDPGLRARPVGEQARRQTAPVKLWAGIGAAFVLLNLVIYVPWLAEGPKTTPTGSDPVPGGVKLAVVSFEILSICIATTIIVVLVRSCLRQRRITVTAAFAIAWVLNMWQDPFINLIKPIFFYNAYFVNVGCWCSHTPLWSSPNGGRLADDLLGTSGVGYIWFVLPPVLAVMVLRRAHRRWPRLTLPRAFGLAVLTTGLFDLVLEAPPVYEHLWGYPGAVHSVSLWGGTDHQFPLYEPVLWGTCWAITAMLMYYLDDRGNTVLERGIDHLRLSPWRRNVMRVLAVTGGVSVVYLTYSVIFVGTSLLPNTTTPSYPSYMRDGICGKGTDYPCPASGLPFYTRYQPTPRAAPVQR
jgi:Spirocyclase AveC-like